MVYSKTDDDYNPTHYQVHCSNCNGDTFKIIQDGKNILSVCKDCGRTEYIVLNF